MYLYIPIFHLAPSDTPQNVTTELLNSTYMRITFHPPFAIGQNGPITSYKISYTGEPYNTVTQYKVISIPNPIYPAVQSVSINITGLQEYNNYTFSVRANNREGSSGLSAQVEQTTGISGKKLIVSLLSDALIALGT